MRSGRVTPLSYMPSSGRAAGAALRRQLYAAWCRWRYLSPSWIAIQATKMMTGVIHSNWIEDPVAHRTSTSATTATASLTCDFC